MSQPIFLIHPHLLKTQYSLLNQTLSWRLIFNTFFTHHSLVLPKFNLSIYYPLLYERTVWYYKRAADDIAQRAIELFDWNKALCVNDVDK